ncbi:MAG: ABC transporter permease [Anaerolineales bacterium]|uniref:Transport permease protein n=1 Tax=Candidatus Desulfolinea nitratireducens TaxID=2841698 RepID=A0A8J6NHD1_9CHLR|nr:ABC transporter permease [Candidatus Desulfolinea nitratireducens]MBL6959517.1 ABC transporter permease [Anaerolineales bacterium]
MTKTELATTTPQKEMLTIRPPKGWISLNLRDLWLYRELITFLTWRDILILYKQTLLGASWAVINPIVNMLVLEFIFGNLAQMDTGGIPGPIFRYTALLPWMLFSKALSSSGRSMLTNRGLITKIYFPRLVIPLSSVLSGVVDFGISFLVMIGMMIYYKVTLTWAILVMPLLVVMTLIVALGVGLWLSALNVLYRDVGYILPMMTQLWLFLSPVGYSSASIPENLQLLYALNPMTGVIEAFRWAMLGDATATLGLQVVISAVVALIVLVSGLYFFRRMERTFADMI